MTPQNDPIRCEEALDLIEPYLDGELPPAEAARLRDHLEGCPACAAELALARRIQGSLRALPQPDCPPEVIARVVRAGRGEVVPFAAPAVSAGRRARAVRGRLAAAAAVAALAVGGGTLFLHLQQQREQEARPSQAEVAEATREARLALAYVGKVSRRAGLDVRDEVLQKRLVIPTARSLSRSLGDLQGPAGEPRKEL
jgi:anti-sigma factor (TIGR02949 family)